MAGTDFILIEQEPNPELERQKLKERMGNVVHRLRSNVEDRINKRQALEDRWIEDLEQYHGRYDRKTESNLASDKKSKLFINLTRTKTDGMSARLMDLLFPTDDRNWGIQPTPVPLLTADADKAVKALREIEEKLKAKQEAQAAQAQQQPGQAGAAPAAPSAEPDDALKALQEEAEKRKQYADRLQAMLTEAKDRCDSMQDEIDDQLTASGYHAAMRDMIDDACKLGTGVCKGPVTGDKVRRGWKKTPVQSPDGQEVGSDFTLQMAGDEDSVPAIRYVDVWNFFPDMDVRNIADSEGEFERHLMNAKQLRGLGRLPGFDKDALRRLLSAKPKRSMPNYVAQLRDITGKALSTAREAYQVFEYSGPLSVEDLRDIATDKQDMDTLDDLKDIDPLDEINAIVWFCEDEILKIAPYPFDSGETIYSVFNLLKDEATVFGYGIPWIMKDPQRSLNAGWRAMMDNAGRAAGPQIIVAQDQIEPANGDWTIEPNKVWRSKGGIPKDERAFQVAEIPMYQAELANIVAISKQFIDDMTAMPSVAQGEQGNSEQKTAFGTAILMNGANVTFRRIVKAFDDDVTVPNVTRFYDWNMQFSSKEEIKGDYGVDARGSSVLLVRELQAQNLMAIAISFGGHPVYGPMLKNRNLLKKIFQAHLIPADEVLLTEDEISAITAQAQASAQNDKDKSDAETKQMEMQLKQSEIQAKVEMSNQESQTRLKVAQIAHETAMMTLAETMNMDKGKLEAMLEKNRQMISSKERMFAAEAAMTERTGPTGGGNF